MVNLTPQEVRMEIHRGGFKLNPYAKAYVEALDDSFILYGVEGLKTQIIYIFTNIRAKKGLQQQIKKELMAYAKSR